MHLRPLFILLILSTLTSPALAEDAAPLSAGDALTHGNLTLFPLYREGATLPEGVEAMLTFEEAVRAEVLIVTELEGNTSAAQVNAVHVANRSDRDVFIMGGEVILGGKQDRIIGKDTVIPANTDTLEVGVFCVEHGRWDGQTAAFKASGEVSHSKLREQAIFGDDQGKVWAEVAEANEKNDARNATDTYRESLEKGAGEDVQGYVDALLPKLEADDAALGVAIAISGTIVAVDAFANPRLFAANRDKLVRSYALEASSAEATGGPASRDDLLEVLADIQSAKDSAAPKDSGAASNTYTTGKRVKGVQARQKKAAEGAGGSFDFEAPVHEYYTVD